MTASDTRVDGRGSGHEEGEGSSSGSGTAKEADVKLRAIRHELGISAELTELAKVRQWVRTVLRGLPANIVGTAVMVVDELTSNALRHGRAPYHVRLLTGAAKLRIEVEDAGGEPARRRAPSERGGRGLLLVERCAAAWGQLRRPGGKTLWAELPTGQDAAGSPG
jgi:anti-sigma regulatory factor (Ser/Thr protein kinase)